MWILLYSALLVYFYLIRPNVLTCCFKSIHFIKTKYPKFKRMKQKIYPKNVVFYLGEDDVPSIMPYCSLLNMNGIGTKLCHSADRLIDRCRTKPKDVDLFVLELIVPDYGNDFKGLRNDRYYPHSALLLLNELDVLGHTVPIIKQIPKIVLTSHAMDGRGKAWQETHDHVSLHKALIKKQTTPDMFLGIVQQLLG